MKNEFSSRGLRFASFDSIQNVTPRPYLEALVHNRANFEPARPSSPLHKIVPLRWPATLARCAAGPNDRTYLQAEEHSYEKDEDGFFSSCGKISSYGH